MVISASECLPAPVKFFIYLFKLRLNGFDGVGYDPLLSAERHERYFFSPNLYLAGSEPFDLRAFLL